MPCYCDIPDKESQVEIERRAKERMYFEAIEQLTDKQLDECKIRELKGFPIGNINVHLCKLCKVLSDEQLREVSAYYFKIEWPHKTLYDWYIKHIEDDKMMDN